MSARSDVASLAIVAGVHLVIGGVHQYAHAVAEVKNSLLQAVFIVLVVASAAAVSLAHAARTCAASLSAGVLPAFVPQDACGAPRGREKHLIIGNHDVTGPGEVRTLGFDAVWSVMTSPGDPPLLWTHYPLRDVPEGHVNVHGHEHGKGRTEVPKIVDWYMDEKSEIDPPHHAHNGAQGHQHRLPPPCTPASRFAAWCASEARSRLPVLAAIRAHPYVELTASVDTMRLRSGGVAMRTTRPDAPQRGQRMWGWFAQASQGARAGVRMLSASDPKLGAADGVRRGRRSGRMTTLECAQTRHLRRENRELRQERGIPKWGAAR